MKSKRSKGNENELYVQKYYEANGYTCHRARQSFIKTKTGVFTRSNDIFTVFDIIAKKKNSKTLWIQVSTGSRKAEKEKKILSIGDIFNEQDEIQLWLNFKGGIWQIFRLTDRKFEMISKIERGQFLDVVKEGGKQ